MKIVSLLPSATEIVYALELEDRLEGVTHECDFPPEARHKAVVSTTSLPAADGLSAGEIDRLVTGKVEAGEPLYVLDDRLIRKLQPDLILAQDLCRVCAVPSGQVTKALEALGCSAEVLSLDPVSLDEIIDGIESVGRAAGATGRAAELAAELRGRKEVVRRRAEALKPVRTLALEWADPPFAGGHWIPEMVAAAGGEDIAGRAGEPSMRTTWDAIGEGAPGCVVYMPCGFDLGDAIDQARLLYDLEAFAALPAARSGEVYAVEASAYFSRPGPRIVDGLEILASILHPEAFPQPPQGRMARVAPGH